MAILHVKSPNGTDYNMTIVTSGTTESIADTGWSRFPNGLLIQWGHAWPGGSGSWNCNGHYAIEFSQVFAIAITEDMAVGDDYYLNNRCIGLGYMSEISNTGLCVFRSYYEPGTPAGFYHAIGC